MGNRNQKSGLTARSPSARAQTKQPQIKMPRRRVPPPLRIWDVLRWAPKPLDPQRRARTSVKGRWGGSKQGDPRKLESPGPFILEERRKICSQSGILIMQMGLVVGSIPQSSGKFLSLGKQETRKTQPLYRSESSRKTTPNSTLRESNPLSGRFCTIQKPVGMQIPEVLMFINPPLNWQAGT